MVKWGVAGAIAVSMVATSAFAAGVTRSAQALPGAQAAPVTGVRTATPLKRTSSQSDDSPVLGYVLAAVVGAGVIAATIAATSDDNGPDSAG